MAADPVPQPVIDVAAYCRRIGYTGPVEPTIAVLRALHEVHVGAIPFENVDVLLECPILLDADSLQRKLVHSRRGGYCFEQNLLFKDILETIGYSVVALAARVRFGTTGIRPRTHMTLLVTAEGRQYLCDTGFGAHGLLRPIPFEAGPISECPLVSFRLAREDPRWVLQATIEGQWADLYAFTMEPQERIDYVVASHFVATYPDSIFRKMLTAQLVRPDERRMLRHGELRIVRETGEQVRTVRNAADAVAVLQDLFGIELPPGATLPAAVFPG